MLYVNQLNYSYIKYITKTDRGGINSTVRSSGCGLCSAIMVADYLTGKSPSVTETVQLSYDSNGNHSNGTDMKLFAPAFAEKYGLDYRPSNDSKELKEHLASGGAAILHIGGDHDGRVGLFSHGGHYVAAVGINGDEICILDPSYRQGKYDEAGRIGKVRMEYPYVYCDISEIVADTSNRNPHYHLFGAKAE